MKKYAGISAAIVLICAIAFVPSCIVEESYNGIDAPIVETHNNSHIISFAPVSDMLYANVFREESIDGFDSVSETLNIGQVIPRGSIGKYATFIFTDAYVGGSDDTEYRYFIRYWDNAKYTYSKTSRTMPTLSTDKTDASLTANDGLEFLYVQNDYDLEKTYTLFLQHEINVPTDFEELHVIIGIDGQPTKKPFLLASCPDDETKSPYPVGGNVDDIPNSAAMNLYTALPATFRDRKLTVDGIIGVHKESYINDDENIKYVNYYWTTPILLSEKTIQYAHKDSKGTWEPDKPEIKDGQITRYYSSPVSTFIVPSIQEPQNDFDYSDADRAAVPVADNAAVADGIPSLDITPFRP
ncbi:MAG: hypothetical protein K2M90_08180 [Treponemataceae bacterium]|nr:hypothetical protein [Treponemataceae bacterium]MDE7392416.1 hypothetical protein [Treponemataceae bacterium]